MDHFSRLEYEPVIREEPNSRKQGVPLDFPLMVGWTVFLSAQKPKKTTEKMESKTNPERGNNNAEELKNSEAINGAESSTKEAKSDCLRFGLKPEEVEVQKEKLERVIRKPKAGNRKAMIDDIISHAEAMIVDSDGITLHSAGAVHGFLQDQGLARKADGSLHLGANGFGDAMGGHGLELPCRILGGKKRYDLASVNDDAATKADTQEVLNDLSVAEFKALRYI